MPDGVEIGTIGEFLDWIGTDQHYSNAKSYDSCLCPLDALKIAEKLGMQVKEDCMDYYFTPKGIV